MRVSKVLDLDFDVFGQRVGVEGLFGGCDRYEPPVRRQRGEVGTVNLGFPAVGIEVRHPHLVALSFELLYGDVAERAVEREWFGMSEDK
jgi:hypothetical protein